LAVNGTDEAEIAMSNVQRELRNGRVISTHTLPVRQIEAQRSPVDGYVAIVRIEKDGEVLADWHLPRHARHWATESEAQRDALEYAATLIDLGALDEMPSAWLLAG
jgi:hypothetical protein